MPRKKLGGSGDAPSNKDVPGGVIEGQDTGSAEEAPQSEQREVRSWHDRIRAADKQYLEWARRFKCAQTEQFYENIQWPETLLTGDPRTEPYTVNLIHSTVETKMPELYFFRPSMRVTPRPSRSDEQLSQVSDRAKLQEDTVNTFVQDPRTGYLTETTLALRDTFFRFGVVEVGYSADFVDNPNAGKPALNKDGTEFRDESDQPIIQPNRKLNDKNPNPELFYIRHVEAARFRVALHTPANLERGDWCGYYEWHYIDDLKKDKHLSRASRLKPQGRLTQDLRGEDQDADRERYGLDASLPTRRGMVKIWKIWNTREKVRFIVPDTQRFFLLKPTPYKVFPFPTLKMTERRFGWYPYPPTTTWVSPQAEFNETRESQRIHRRRFHRRFQAVENSVDTNNLSKLETGTDGTLVFTKTDNAIRPIEDAPLDPAVTRNIAIALNDFQQVTNSGGEQRGVPEATTATQANIVDQRAQIRENYQRQAVAKWHAAIGRTLLLFIREYALMPFWIERNVDPLQLEATAEAERVALIWEQIESEKLGDISLDISVDMEELSPINEASERSEWNNVLGLIGGSAGQNLLFLLGASDAMLRKTLKLHGIRSDRDMADVRNALRVTLAANGILQALEAAKAIPGVMGPITTQGQPDPGAQMAPPQPQQGMSAGPTPTNADTQGQMQAQGVVQ